MLAILKNRKITMAWIALNYYDTLAFHNNQKNLKAKPKKMFHVQ